MVPQKYFSFKACASDVTSANRKKKVLKRSCRMHVKFSLIKPFIISATFKDGNWKKKHKTQNKQTKKNTHKKNPQKQSKSKARKKFGRLYNVVCTYWSMAFFFISIVTGRQITEQTSFEFEFNLPFVTFWIWQQVNIPNWEDKQYTISCLPC